MAGKSTVNFVVGADVIENDFFVHDFHAKDNAIGVCYADGRLPLRLPERL